MRLARPTKGSIMPENLYASMRNTNLDELGFSDFALNKKIRKNYVIVCRQCFHICKSSIPSKLPYLSELYVIGHQHPYIYIASLHL